MDKEPHDNPDVQAAARIGQRAAEMTEQTVREFEKHHPSSDDQAGK